MCLLRFAKKKDNFHCPDNPSKEGKLQLELFEQRIYSHFNITIKSIFVYVSCLVKKEKLAALKEGSYAPIKSTAKRLLGTCKCTSRWEEQDCVSRPQKCINYAEMEPYSCGAILCVFVCLIIGGMMAFRVFNTWKKDFTRPQIDRPRNITWKPHEAVENNCHETCCKTVSHITPTIIRQKLWLFCGFLSY